MNGEIVEQEGWHLKGYLAALRLGKWLILGALLAGLLAAAGWTLSTTPIYEATATLQIGPPPFASFLSGPQQPSYVGWMLTSQPFDSEIQVLKSRTLAEEVVKQLQAGSPSERGQFGQAVNDLRGRINVQMIKGTNIMAVKVRSSVSEAAAREANTLSEAHIAYTARRRTTSLSSAEEFIGRQLELVGRKLTTMQQTLKGYQVKHRTLTVASETLLNKVIAADVSKAKLEAARKETEALLDFAKQPKPGTSPGPFVLINPNSGPLALQTVTRLGELVIQQAKLRTMFTERHPEVVSLEIGIKELKARLIQETEAMVQTLKVQEQNLIGIIGQHEAELKRLPSADVDIIELIRSAKVAEELYGFFLKKQEEARIAVASEVGDARILDRALPPGVPVLPNTQRNLFTGGIVGLVLGLGLAFVRQRLDRSVRSIKDLEKLGLPVFGTIPAIALGGSEGRKGGARWKAFPLLARIEQRSPAAEAYRSLRTNIQFAALEVPAKCFVFTSPGPGEGKSLTTANLGIALAEMGRRVLVVDADLRKPVLHNLFRVPRGAGLTNLLVGQVEWQTQVRPTEIENLELLPSGPIPPNPSTILGSNRMKLLLQELARHYDVVLIDSPPILLVTDAAVLGSMADGVFLVARAGVTTPEALLRARVLLQAANTRVTGTILNAARPQDGDYYYAYYYSDNGEGEADRKNGWPLLKQWSKLIRSYRHPSREHEPPA